MARVAGPDREARRLSRVLDAPAYVLHSQAWRETSLLLQAFTRDHGIIALSARGAKRPYSMLRPVLGVFQPLALSWSGKSEIRNLIAAQSLGVVALGQWGFISAWYMNELLLRLLARDDPHPALFEAYAAALLELANDGNSGRGAQPVSACLRRFEWVLLKETGWGLDGPQPDFTDARQEPELRRMLHQRLDSLLDKPLLTRKVLHDMQRPLAARR